MVVAAALSPTTRVAVSPLVASPSAFLSPVKLLLLVVVDIYCTTPYLHTNANVVVQLLPRLIRESTQSLAFDATPNPTPSLWDHLERIEIGSEAADRPYTVQDDVADRLSEFTTIADLDALIAQALGLVVFQTLTGDAQDDEVQYVEESSVLGLFIRRCWLAYKQLEFHEASRLYQQFTRLIQALREPHQPRTAPMIARFDVEQFIDAQVQALADGSQTNAFSPHLTRQLQSLGRLFPQLPKTHFAQYLAAARQGDYDNARQSLHRFFDYMGDRGPKTLYQYALLNLACLESQFHHDADAIRAIQEAVAVARENRDQGCLSYAASWLYRLLRSHPHQFPGQRASEQQMLDSLAGKTKQLNLIHLQCLSELNRTRQRLLQGHPPAAVLEGLMKCLLLLRTHRLSRAVGTCFMLTAAAWQTYGYGPVAILYTQLQLLYHGAGDEQVYGYCQLARFCAEHNDQQSLQALDIHVRQILAADCNAMASWQACQRDLALEQAVFQQDGPTAAHILAAIATNPTTQSEHQTSSTIKQLWSELYLGHYAKAFPKLRAMVDGHPESADRQPPFVQMTARNLLARGYVKTGLVSNAVLILGELLANKEPCTFANEWLTALTEYIRCLGLLGQYQYALQLADAMAQTLTARAHLYLQSRFWATYASIHRAAQLGSDYDVPWPRAAEAIAWAQAYVTQHQCVEDMAELNSIMG
ncbi:hypothetical protein H4R34_002221 [Dimargaris verticillata]|uniref:Anaphase-promoting complex subunit 5 n=1 Tax=Dimargaris verticillata TaxID=2761393 RepID=A0A9W8ED34_9FUNG|nr:hypothetical protein H4R34_002221 [Dimargaris verticillata]